MRYAFVGYGKMGHAIEALLKDKGEIVARIGSQNADEIATLNAENVSVVFEFSTPEAVWGNLETLIRAGVPVVTGTTGWYGRLQEIKALVKAHEGRLIYGANFSIGANVLFKINEYLANIMRNFSDYDCIVEEKHHFKKADAPGGTALQLAQTILEILPNKNKIAFPSALETRPIAQDELCITAGRVGSVVGEHTVGYYALGEQIEIKHRATDRTIFASGAILAADRILSLPSGVYAFSDFFSPEKLI